MNIKLLPLVIGIALILTSCGNGSSRKEKDQKATRTEEAAQPVQEKKAQVFDPSTLAEEPEFEIKTTEGTIVIKLYKDTPKHRDNFIKLASEGFFDGILFHRVINNFMIQTGDPLTRDASKSALYGTGGPGYTIPAEILPQHKHKKGALAAARRGDAANPERESSGSQFYLVQSPATCAQLDGQYTVFGETVSGIEIIDKIAGKPTAANDRPVQDIKIVSVLPRK